jgi:uncharacterized protein DUF6881
MKYVRVGWKHQHADEPVILYGELGDDRFEVRKVEVYRNGMCRYASAEEASGTTALGVLAMPELSEIAKDPQFDPMEITRDDASVEPSRHASMEFATTLGTTWRIRRWWHRGRSY